MTPPVDPSIHAILRRKHDEVAAELQALIDEPVDPTAAVSFGKRVGEGTTQAIARIESTSAARSLAATLADVDRALAKVDEGTYGTCDRCGATIPAERLEARPWTALCVACASAG
jgi:DnaK suppressor protein